MKLDIRSLKAIALLLVFAGLPTLAADCDGLCQEQLQSLGKLKAALGKKHNSDFDPAIRAIQKLAVDSSFPSVKLEALYLLGAAAGQPQALLDSKHPSICYAVGDIAASSRDMRVQVEALDILYKRLRDKHMGTVRGVLESLEKIGTKSPHREIKISVLNMLNDSSSGIQSIMKGTPSRFQNLNDHTLIRVEGPRAIKAVQGSLDALERSANATEKKNGTH